MNSRRLMCSPESKDCTLPHSGRKYRVVHHSKFGDQCLSWVKIRLLPGYRYVSFPRRLRTLVHASIRWPVGRPPMRPTRRGLPDYPVAGKSNGRPRLSRVLSIVQQMRRGCGVSFHQQRT
jgi:hypothetical protein